MRILLTGVTGQVGRELQRSLQVVGEVVAVDRRQMDLADLGQVAAVVRAIRPDLIVNPAAYTAVDKAESEPGLARLINAEAPRMLAEEAARLGARIVHYSTDYVFDGSKQGAYLETDMPNPINVYGQTKLEGERAIAATGVPHLIFRTSWVYGMHGKNFLQTMLRLGRERREIGVVGDQVGAPTWARTIAEATAVVLAQAKDAAWWHDNGGIYHMSTGGATSWCGFAQAIMENAGLSCRVKPITTTEYPLPAARPMNSMLSHEKLTARLCSLPDWRTALDLCIGESCAWRP